MPVQCMCRMTEADLKLAAECMARDHVHQVALPPGKVTFAGGLALL